MTKCLEELNALLHSQIKTFLAKNTASPQDHDNIDIDSLIDKMNPKIWNAVTVLTKSATEKRGTSKVANPASSTYHVKRIRRLFLLCNIMFITDDRCSVPLHILMADLVESQGVSALLHKVLNRVGVCASADTLARFVQHKVTVLQGMENMYINKEHFTVVSADNVDFMHTYARVVKGKQNSSWHGTTVQAVQPLPSLSLCSRLDGQSAPPHRGTGAVLEHETTQYAPSCETGAPFGPTHPLSAHTQSAPPHRGTGAVLEHETSQFAPSGETGAPFGSTCPLSAHTQSAPPHRGTGAVLEHETTQFAPSCETGPPFGPTRPLSAHIQSAPLHGGTGAVLEHETTQFAPSCETGAPFGPTRPLSAHTISTPPHRGTGAVLEHETTQSRKRTQRTSPYPSPLKQTLSPVPKQRRRARTGTENQHSSCPREIRHQTLTGRSRSQVDILMKKSLSEFEVNHEEAQALSEIQEELNVYMLMRNIVSNKRPQCSFLGLQQFFSVTRTTHTEKSNIFYLEVMDAIADSKDTMTAMLHHLYQKFIEGQGLQYLLVEGDAKLFDVLQSLKHEYGDELSWMLPYPGGWHTLKNYQPALLKAYYDAGLKDMARAAGYPVNQIQTCSQFKRVHNFMFESWEAVYRAMLRKFLSVQNSNPDISQDVEEVIFQSLESLHTTSQSHSDGYFYHNFSQEMETIRTSEEINFQKFTEYLQSMADQDDTWKFWKQYVLEDALAYIGLYLAIRSGDWYQRMVSLKLMAPVFTAFDHQNYQKLISQHLADVLCMPPELLAGFKQGAFVVSITGRIWHSVAIDEAHEMLINKECKTSITRPTPDYINRVAQYLPYRTKAMENIRKELFPETSSKETAIHSPFSSESGVRKCEHNVLAIMDAISCQSLLEVTGTSRGLLNPFSGKMANPQQLHDLLHFREIGKKKIHAKNCLFHSQKAKCTSSK